MCRLALWNFALLLFSFIGTYRAVPHLLYNMMSRPFSGMICAAPSQTAKPMATMRPMPTKITSVMSEALERPLSKSLQRGEDPHFDQLLSAFGSVAEHCLPSILKTLIAWYEKQGVEWIVSDYKPSKSDSKGKFELSLVSEMEFVSERRDLAVEFIFCLVLIEVLKQFHVHPGHEELVHYIENLCFKHFN